MGTPLFSSPEILTKNIFSEKSDSWAVGIVLFHLCCLKLPFHEKSYRRIIESIKSKSPGHIPPQFGPNLQRVISRLLDKDPGRRASVSEVLEMPFVKQLGVERKRGSMMIHKGKSCEFNISQKSLKTDFENIKIYKNSNFMTKDVLEKLEDEKNWDSDSNLLEVNESIVIENKNDEHMGKQLKNEDIHWLRERMSIAGSIKTSSRQMPFTDFSNQRTESDK